MISKYSSIFIKIFLWWKFDKFTLFKAKNIFYFQCIHVFILNIHPHLQMICSNESSCLSIFTYLEFLSIIKYIFIIRKIHIDSKSIVYGTSQMTYFENTKIQKTHCLKNTSWMLQFINHTSFLTFTKTRVIIVSHYHKYLCTF